MEKFKFLTHENHDAFFNLASEEYLLKEKGGYYFYLWRNAPAVIVGINQNTIEEVNLDFTETHGIKVVRRLTGGGAVYHDLENICYTVIAPFDSNVDNYKKFTAPVIEYLNQLGVKAEFSGRNDITVSGKKISGNAQTIVGDKIMHHGTLLFNTDMSVLAGALKPNKLKTDSKGIKSVRARVVNIYDELPVKMSVEEFMKGLYEFFKKDCEEYKLTDNDIDRIKKLRDEKYSTYEWNIGRSPKGTNRFCDRFDFGTFTFDFDTVNGKIENPAISGDFFSKKPIEDFAEKLVGVEFKKDKVKEVFSLISDYIVNADGKIIAERIFK